MCEYTGNFIWERSLVVGFKIPSLAAIFEKVKSLGFEQDYTLVSDVTVFLPVWTIEKNIQSNKEDYMYNNLDKIRACDTCCVEHSHLAPFLQVDSVVVDDVMALNVSFNDSPSTMLDIDNVKLMTSDNILRLRETFSDLQNYSLDEYHPQIILGYRVNSTNKTSKNISQFKTCVNKLTKRGIPTMPPRLVWSESANHHQWIDIYPKPNLYNYERLINMLIC